ncbi:hypothetical protein GFD30_00285 [Glycomyces sp. NEAU-7082]|uniref:Uncharacterized protein n=1 Tax=Glycomyces albidus TaxID=2656774 RepID=A0A6L5G2T6_9ACTN|nr:hypothetical protein [Glycomyces albidus]
MPVSKHERGLRPRTRQKGGPRSLPCSDMGSDRGRGSVERRLRRCGSTTGPGRRCRRGRRRASGGRASRRRLRRRRGGRGRRRRR